MRLMRSNERRIASALLLTVILCNSAALTQRNMVLASAFQSPVKTFLVTPSQGTAGKDQDLLISSPGCEGHHELANAALVAPTGTPITVTKIIERADCTLRATINIPAGASIGRVTLWITDDKNKLLGTAEIEIKGKFLHNAQILGTSELTVQGVMPSEDGTSVKADVILTPNTKAGKYKLTVFDPQFPDNKKLVEFEVLPKG